MKILVVNSRYFVSGGPERYMFNLLELLTRRGHTVYPFSIRYAQNEPCPYEQYFVSPLSGPDAVRYSDHEWDLGTVIKTLERAFYSREVYESLSRLILAVRPDFAVVLQYLRKLSPAVLSALSVHRIPFVVRLSDFGMICPNAHLIKGGEPCEQCINGRLFNSVWHGCVQNSRGASLVNYLATRFHQTRGYYNLIPFFIVPSKFTISKMVAAGWDRRRFVHLPTFVEPYPESLGTERRGIAYVGRVEHNKGVHLLLKAAELLRDVYSMSAQVKIIGNGAGEYRSSLERFVAARRLDNVTFAGTLAKEEVLQRLAESSCSVVPSLWYDNMPNSLLESLASGTPAIVPDHGSFPEIVQHETTGLQFAAGDAGSLAKCLAMLLEDPVGARRMGENARSYVREHHSPDIHYNGLMEIYSTVRSMVERGQVQN